jgi:hypothetical protein
VLYKVDWLSFTIAAPVWENVPYLGLRSAAYTAMGEWAGDWWKDISQGRAWNLEGGRAPFNLSIMRDDGGARLFFSASLPLMLLEVTGTGCTAWAENGDIFSAMLDLRDHITRLDVACDFETDVKPAEFAVLRDGKRFQAHGEVVSPTGETYYVGSLKSERFARVYRYNPPHPRAGLLRVEHVFRKESARLAVDYLGGHSPEEWIDAIGKIYGWTHDIWGGRIARNKEGMPSRVVERPEMGKTVFWLYNTVAPCLARMVRENRVSWEDFEQEVHTLVLKAAAIAAGETPEEGNDHA